MIDLYCKHCEGLLTGRYALVENESPRLTGRFHLPCVTLLLRTVQSGSVASVQVIDQSKEGGIKG